MKILFNGCSMVEGTSTNTWTDICSKSLNLEYVNLGTTMASNEHIMRTTIDCLCSNKFDIVCIGWTSMDRAELPLKNGDYVRMTPYASNSVQTGPVDDYHKNYYTNHYNEWLHFQKTLRAMYVVDELCRQKNTVCLHFNSVYHNHIQDYKALREHSLWSIRKNRPDNPLRLDEYSRTDTLAKYAQAVEWILPSPTTLVSWCKERELPQDQWGHPLDQANQQIAEYMCEKINDFIC